MPNVTAPASAEFVAQVADAYEHLYDLVYLRTHPLLRLPQIDQRLPAKERAWRLHQILLEAIEALDPGPQAPTQSRTWRRHRLMVLRYLEGMEVQAVADDLGISKRHCFREHEVAIAAIASLLADAGSNHSEAEPAPDGGSRAEPGRLELLRLEAARLARSSHQAPLAEVLLGAVQLAGEMARRRGVHIRLEIAPNLPPVAADRNTLRQLILGLLSHLLERLDGGEIAVTGAAHAGCVTLSLDSFGVATALSAPAAQEAQMRLSMLHELAAVQNIRVQSTAGESGALGFCLELATTRPRTILVVDDNHDALHLFERYLTQHNYQVVMAQSGAEALEKAREVQPFAVTLDLMMPGRDGWDVLQTLTNQPATQHIPIIICTVLAAKEMALSLGAAAFLAKPVSEQALIEALEALG